MSMDDAYDAMYDEILRDPPMDLVLQVLDDFAAEQLSSYFLEHPLLTENAGSLLVEARKLRNEFPAASIAFAGASIEVALRDAIVKPLLHGLLHTEHPAIDYLAKPLADMMLRDKKVGNRFIELVAEFGGIDLREFKRDGASVDLWKEINKVRLHRNEILHAGSLRNSTYETREGSSAPVQSESDTRRVALSPGDIRNMSDIELQHYMDTLRSEAALAALNGTRRRSSRTARLPVCRPAWRPLSEEAEQALTVAGTVMETIVPIVIVNLGFQLADIRMAENDNRTSIRIQAHGIRLQP